MNHELQLLRKRFQRRKHTGLSFHLKDVRFSSLLFVRNQFQRIIQAEVCVIFVPHLHGFQIIHQHGMNYIVRPFFKCLRVLQRTDIPGDPDPDLLHHILSLILVIQCFENCIVEFSGHVLDDKIKRFFIPVLIFPHQLDTSFFSWIQSKAGVFIICHFWSPPGPSF